MKKLLMGIIATFGFPVLAVAASYDYVTTAQTLATVEANSPAQAIAIAPNIDPHSGVMVHRDGTPSLIFGANLGADGNNLYQYVDRSGNLRTVRADNPMQAMLIAPNIDPHSGVMIVS